VLEVERRSHAVGGAANTAANVAALGGRAVLAGLIGIDAAGQRLTELLPDLGIDVSPVIADPDRPTTSKTRVVAGTQQVVRIDHEQPGPVAGEAAARLLDAIGTALPGVRAVVVSDYGKGVVTPAVAGRVIAAATAAGVPVVVDPKGTDYAKYRGATLVKPNQLEAGQVLNRSLRTGEDVDRAAADLVGLLGGRTGVLVTRGPHGMTAFEPGKPPVHVPAHAREVYDVTGAGDTVAAALTLALAAGASLATACHLASRAAAVVVGKAGTAVCTADELRAELAR
jgi:rfaE bifunctional protein kinase chain/domain